MIKLICVGKIKERYLQDGISEYVKRLKPYCDLEIIEIKESTKNEKEKNILEEEKLILQKIKQSDYVVVLEINGVNLSSEDFARKVDELYSYHPGDIVFVIGGSDGLGQEINNRSNYRLSFGKNTYPHQLMRLIFVEQIYRCFMINHNTKYHK